MKFNNIINELLGDRIQISTLKHLYLHEEGITGSTLAKLTGCSNFKIGRVLKALVSHGLVKMQSIGKANVYRLHRSHILAERLVIPLIQFERSLFSELGKKILELLPIKPLSVILYGSIARGDELADSDIDLLLVYDDEETKHSIVDVGERINSITIELFGNSASVRRSTVSQLAAKIRQKDKELIKNIIKEGRVLTGLSITEVLENAR